MSDNGRKRVSLTDRMVLASIGLGAIYWVIETVLYVISSGFDFYSRLIGPDLDGLSTRIIVLCLFLIFGSHVQYTINKQKENEEELEEMREINEMLQAEILELKKR